ncbi:MAG TPA: gamma-glutamyltransferase family protein [Patescibacteria group bacterium]|nr:gamma-glutamyltransferase family protein [Patescibacteria group bacterium]
MEIPRPLVPAPLARGGQGAVVAPHHLATTAGLGILRAGGSAVDAAIATNAVLAVVFGGACGIGGDAFWLIWDEAAAAEVALNGSGRAPASADAAALRTRGMATLPFRGPLTITVPGAVRSWGDAHARYGRLQWADLLAPAVELASDGFPVDDSFARAVEGTAGVLARELGDGARGWASTYRPLGRPWQPGERIRLPALARTLERIAAAGADDLYSGELAARQATGLAAAGSGISAADLAAHTSTWGTPLALDYRGATATTHPPNSAGLVGLEILNVLRAIEPPEPGIFAPGNGGATAGADLRWVHLGIEVTKRALADRDAHLSDPEFVHAPVERLLDRVHGEELGRSIDPDRASSPPPSRAPIGGGTIWLGVVDRQGNAVSLIESNYAGFGSGIVDPATGIAYQNRGSYFSLEPDHPNVLAPRKRTLHTLLPGMLFRDGRPWVVHGSMGGDAQPAIFAQVVSALVDGAVDVATAVAAPRWSPTPPAHFAPPDVVQIEPRFRPGLLDRLAAMGHRLDVRAPFDGALGHAHAIELVAGGPARGGTLAAATDPRSPGLAATW